MKRSRTAMMEQGQRRGRALVFVGNYGNRNIGDDAILQALSERYARSHPAHRQFVVVRAHPEDVRRVSTAAPLPLTPRSLALVLRRIDTVVIGGGGLFGAGMGPVARFVPLFALLTRAMGKRIIYESIGFYSATPPLQRLLIYASMLTANRVRVRDAASWRMTRFVRRFRMVEQVEDAGAAVHPVSRDQALALVEREGIALDFARKCVVGVSIKRIIGDERATRVLADALAPALQCLLDSGHALLFLPFCHDPMKWSEKDLEFSLEIVDRLRPGSRAYCLREYYTPGELAGVMCLTHACIAMRYHAQVFAHALGVPLVPLAYEEKRTDFIHRHGYPLIPITDKTGEVVLHCLSRILAAPTLALDGCIAAGN